MIEMQSLYDKLKQHVQALKTEMSDYFSETFNQSFHVLLLHCSSSRPKPIGAAYIRGFTVHSPPEHTEYRPPQ